MTENLYNDEVFHKLLDKATEYREKAYKLSYLFEWSDDVMLYDRAIKINQCGQWLKLAKTESGPYVITESNFCRQRLCPMCQWRRSLNVYANIVRLEAALRQSGYEFLHAVLTVRNIDENDLQAILKKMTQSSTAMLKYPEFAGIKGALRCLEVTYSADGTFHPHFHMLLAVRKSYFHSRDYLSIDRFQQCWKKAMRLEYDPIVWMNKADAGALAEIAKYCVKPFDELVNNRDEKVHIYEVLNAVLHGKRTYQSYGVIKAALHELKIDDAEEVDLNYISSALAKPIKLTYNVHRHQYDVEM